MLNGQVLVKPHNRHILGTKLTQTSTMDLFVVTRHINEELPTRRTPGEAVFAQVVAVVLCRKNHPADTTSYKDVRVDRHNTRITTNPRSWVMIKET